MKKLILAIHPFLQTSSRVNKAIVHSLQSLPNVTVHDLYTKYPDFKIDVQHEHHLLNEHNAIIVVHPLYWYSSPPLFKKWIDDVIIQGFAYGEGGNRLEGKIWQSVVSTLGIKEAYVLGGQNLYPLPQLLSPFEATANFCRMKWQKPFAIHHDVGYQLSDEKLAGKVKEVQQLVAEMS